jgi:Ca2+-binding EF-hand superfamily protein
MVGKKTIATLVVGGIMAAGMTMAQAAEHKTGHHEGGKQAAQSQAFKKLDANDDGKITEEEYAARAKNRFAKMLKEMDSDHDGKISEDEATAKAKESFSGLDANKDGAVSMAEWNDHAKKVRHEMHEHLEKMKKDKD